MPSQPPDKSGCQLTEEKFLESIAPKMWLEAHTNRQYFLLGNPAQFPGRLCERTNQGKH